MYDVEKLLLLVSYCLLVSTLFGISLPDKIQELEKKLLTVTNKESIEIFIQLGYLHVNDNPKNDLYFGEEALKNATKFGANQGIAMAYGLIGQSQLKLKDYKEALQNFKEENKLLESEGKPLMVNLFNLGLSSDLSDKERKAIAYFEDCLRIARKRKNREWAYLLAPVVHQYHWEHGSWIGLPGKNEFATELNVSCELEY